MYNQAIKFMLLGFFILSSLIYPALAVPPAQKDPDADKTYKQIQRGSPEEQELFKKHTLPGVDNTGIGQDKVKPDLDVQQEESAENPIEKIKKEKEAKRALEKGSGQQVLHPVKDEKGPEKETGKSVKDPWDFKVNYELKDKANVKVIIFDEKGNPVRKYAVNPDEHGAKKGKNEAVVWDGKDATGNNMPEGEYKAVVVADYGASGKKEKEMKEFRLKK